MQLKQINYWQPLVLLKFIISRVTIIDNYCKKCGKETEPFFVDNDIWAKVVGNEYINMELCFRCFDLINEQKGFHMCWQVTELK